MKEAWKVITDEGYAYIIFTEKGMKKKTFWNYFLEKTSYEYEKEFCKRERASEFDSYADLDFVPIEILIFEHGWWWECNYCCNRIGSDYEGDYFVHNNKIYCDSDCYSKMINDFDNRKKEKENFEIAILSLFPKIEFWFESFGLRANFQLPGMTYPASFIVADKELQIHVTFCDLEIFKQIRDHYSC